MENNRENAAAISLCSLGLGRDTPSTLDPPQTGIAAANDGQTRTVVSAPSIQPFLAPVAPTSTDAIKTEASAPRRKYNVKPRDPKRDTSVTFDEMKRFVSRSSSILTRYSQFFANDTLTFFSLIPFVEQVDEGLRPY